MSSTFLGLSELHTHLFFFFFLIYPHAKNQLGKTAWTLKIQENHKPLMVEKTWRLLKWKCTITLILCTFMYSDYNETPLLGKGTSSETKNWL